MQSCVLSPVSSSNTHIYLISAVLAVRTPDLAVFLLVFPEQARGCMVARLWAACARAHVAGRRASCPGHQASRREAAHDSLGEKAGKSCKNQGEGQSMRCAADTCHLWFRGRQGMGSV